MRKGIRFKEGDFVVITKRNHGHLFEIGETVMVSIAKIGNNGDCCDVYSYGWQNNPGYSVFNKDGYCMGIGDCEVEKSTKEEFYKTIKNRTIPELDLFEKFKAKKPKILQNWNLQFEIK